MKLSLSRHLAASLGAAVVCASVIAGAPAAALAQDVAPAPEGTGLTSCAGTYQVLDASRAGSLSLPARAYTLATTADLNCDEAARLVTEFQRNWGTKLPLTWKPVSDPVGFSNSAGQRFSVTRTSAAGSSKLACPYLTLAQGARAGSVYVGAGRYRLSRSSTSLSCAAAARNFFALAYGTGDPDGSWRVRSVGAGAIQLMTGSRSFTLRRAYSTTSGAGTYPARGEYRCGPFFTVGNNDPIGKKFTVKKGRYSITAFGSTDCAKAVKILPTLLGMRSGVLPSPWRLRSDTGSFVRSASGSSGFRLSPYLGQ
ncbi:MAG: hypothetical protein NWQ82_02735 [Solirubrobacteraceae bacterium]|jgi:hypothetical protein|nr:hypothetical protein [Solirubrobacteraceae bacterium]MDP4920868.1 hypothetical protein [Solirubrobacteraceae bacterium]